MNSMIIGATAMAYAALGAFFARFYARSQDRLFGIFGAAFLILAINRIGLGMLDPGSETRTYLYLVRLAAFLLILWGIIDKNRSAAKG
jgi:hypothetical protein